MKKRVFDLTKEDVDSLNRIELIQSIQRSEGRTLMVENVVSMEPPIDLVSGVELAAGFGADMITFNCLDVFKPEVKILGGTTLSIAKVKQLTGRIVGCNLEPVPEDITDIAVGRSVTVESVKQAIDLGLHYIMLTGNPGMAVSQETILAAIKLVRSLSDEIVIIAGKMHGGGIGNDYNLDCISDFASAGADIMMFPAPYTTPGVSPKLAAKMMKKVHENQMLGMLAIGTSQEGASESYIEKVAMESKAAGADIVHIGDGGFGGIAPPENIITMGMAIRGRRHQYKRMVNRR
ncbi:dihydrodipicolinate synthase [Vibrio sp. SS-MA-C1-2]|uniref:DUF7916 family protein n=1 Tax=Vibrio sp. SS-MA-C1-2 TaxID=2908646 RepID=UPI001F3DAD33|nr:dihydrodipicolinate synthase [Vibrio sp. SS-MA-C1-2]UJF18129.1 dihydrodipicolinate synthase [Vibrio sp. SS-MA-C1-2]